PRDATRFLLVSPQLRYSTGLSSSPPRRDPGYQDPGLQRPWSSETLVFRDPGLQRPWSSETLVVPPPRPGEVLGFVERRDPKSAFGPVLPRRDFRFDPSLRPGARGLAALAGTRRADREPDLAPGLPPGSPRRVRAHPPAPRGRRRPCRGAGPGRH